MAKRKDFTSFTIRLDTHFAEQISAKGRLARRSRCSEVERLLEFAVAYEAEQEKKIPSAIFTSQPVDNPGSSQN